MDILKKVLIIIGGVIAVLLIVALFLPKEMKVERSIEINKPVAEVYPLVADFKNWKKWSAWAEMDTAAKFTLTGTPMQPGHTWAWEGEELGKGQMQISEAKENESLVTPMKFISPMESEAVCYWKFTSTDKGTKATWSFEGTADYPLGRIFGLFVDRQLGGQFDHGLGNLKKMAEGK